MHTTSRNLRFGIALLLAVGTGVLACAAILAHLPGSGYLVLASGLCFVLVFAEAR